MENPPPREWPTVPQLYVNGEFIGGCDILLGSESAYVFLFLDKVNLWSVHQSGELESLFQKHGITPKSTSDAGPSASQ
jgi:monothiol glutaredoxin